METATEVVVTKGTEYFLGAIWRQIGYIRNYKTNIQDLRDKAERLRAERDGVLHQVQQARDNGEEIEEIVKKWLTSADKAIKAAEEILGDERDTVNQRCFMGCCPDWKQRYQLSRKANKETEVDNVRQERTFNQISYRKAVQKLEVLKDYEDLNSRIEVLNGIMRELKDTDASLIGVWGMGGVGKTTLVKQLTSKVKGDGLFEAVAVANVTQTPELNKIQQEIADWLGLKFDVESPGVRAARLLDRLKKQEKVLVVLDNIWQRINLEDIGIPYGKDHKGCKILFTSRNGNVLVEMGVEEKYVFQLKVLQPEEAQQLFEKKVGDLKDPSLKPKAIEVANKCAGLPVLIAAVAVALKDKEECEWNDALVRLKGYNEDDMDEQVNSALDLSYKFLKGDRIKSLFLLCGQIGPTIQFGYLLKFSVGIDLFGPGIAVEDARNRLQKLLNDLKASSLLLESSNHEMVYMHEIVYHYAMSVASRVHQVYALAAGSVVKKWPPNDVFEQWTAISLPWCKLPELPDELKCPKLESLVLLNSDPSHKIPDNFFGLLKKLKFLDLSKFCFSSLPSSLKFLVNLQTLCLHFCESEDITVIGELRQLIVFSLFGSKITRLPSEVGRLTCLQILDLSHCSSLEVIPRNVLSQLTQLEELYMGNCFLRWEGEDDDAPGNNASLAELKLLSELVTVEIQITDAKLLPKDLFSEKLERYRIFIGDDWDWSGKFETSRTLKLKLKTSIELDRIEVLLMRSEDLQLDDLKGVKNVLYELDRKGFPQLKSLHVQNSHEIQYMVDCTRLVNMVAFPRLESLLVDNLNGMEKICHGKLMKESFSKLKKLIVRNCNVLKSLFSLSTFRGLPQLEEIDVNGCKMMEDIVADDDGIGGEDDVIELKRLRSLTLEYLPRLKSFCSQVRDHKTACSEIENEDELELETSWLLFNKKVQFSNIADLKLSLINVEKIWPNQFMEVFPSIQYLTSLTVEGCGNLSYLFPFSMVKKLAQLKKLEISECNVLGEVIVANELKEEEEMRSKMCFPKLEFLKLKGLPLLIRFCKTNLMECPSLKVVWIENCSLLGTFVSSLTMSNVGHSNDDVHLFDEKVSFPNLEELHIMYMHKLKKIWHDELRADSFCKLKVLKVENGKELLKILSSETYRRFWNVEELIVKNCNLVEEVFDLQQGNSHVAAASRLRTLIVDGLSNLKHVWSGDPQGLLSFHNLRYVSAWNCPSLKSIFPFSIAQGLAQLESLNIDTCGLEEFVAKGERAQENPTFDFPQLKYLSLWRLGRLKCFYSEKHVLECPLLDSLSVYLCDQLKVFSLEPQDLQAVEKEKHGSSPEEEVAQPLFSFKKIIRNLEHLALNFKDIPLIQQGQFPVELFHKLKILQLQRSFDASASLPFDASASFPFYLLQKFKNLEKLILGDCTFSFLLPHGTVGEEVGALAKIQFLKLDGLYNIRYLWHEDNQPGQILQNLRTLEIWTCNGLVNLAPPYVSLHNLTILDIWLCHGLENLISFSTAKSMVNLTNMIIRECKTVTEIVAKQADEPLSQCEVVFNKLVSLRLHYLKSLTSFCSLSDCIIKFPSLEELVVTQCPRMKVFSNGILRSPKLKRVYATQGTDKWHWIGDLNNTIKYLHTEMIGFHGLQKLKLSEFPEIKEVWRHGQLLVNLFYNLSTLVIDQCVFSSVSVPSNLLSLLNNLEELEVRNCNSVEQILGVERSSASGVVGYLSKLSKLYLTDLPKLRLLWNEVPEGSFDFKNLKFLKIQNCSSLRFLFTPTMCAGLMQVQEMEVTGCAILEEIIKSGFAEEETTEDVIFPLLKSVTLMFLPNLIDFYSGSGMVQCPSLEKITVVDCLMISAGAFLGKPGPSATNGIIETKVLSPNLKELKLSSLNIGKIWDARQLEISSCIQNLTALTVDRCGNLVYLLSSSMVKSVVNLKRLEVCNCKMMKEIVMVEGLEEEMTSKMLLPQLDFLKLADLPKLAHFCMHSLIECPVLKEMLIGNCPMLIKFVSDSESAGMDASSEPERINSTLFDEKVAFPNLEKLTLLNIDNIELIWFAELHSNSFRIIKKLKVERCKRLLKIFSSCMLRSLLDLEDLVIKNCDSLKEVFDLEEDTNPEARITNQLDTPGLVLCGELRSVHVSDCPSLEFVFTAPIAKGLPRLEYLYLDNCGVKEIVANEGVEATLHFVYPQLKHFDLWKLRELKSFYPGAYTLECPMLNELYVFECENLKVFASAEVMHMEGQLRIHIPRSLFLFDKIIGNLEQLTVNYKDIPVMGQFPEQLFHKLKSVELMGSNDALPNFPFYLFQKSKNLVNLFLRSCYFKVLLPQGIAGEDTGALSQLKLLQLDYLPNLRHIWKQDCQIGQAFENLQTLNVWGCDSLIGLPSSASFQNLWFLDVWKCGGMVSLLSVSTARSMVNLTTLSVRECNMVMEIVANETGDSRSQSQSEIVFKKLTSLKLHCLRSITSFCSSASYIIKLPVLNHVVVTECPKLEVFSEGVAAPKLKRVYAAQGTDQGHWNGDLNSTIKYMNTEMIGFRGLQNLKLSEYPRLNEAWNGQISANVMQRSNLMVGQVAINFFHGLSNLVVDEWAFPPSSVPSNLLPYLNNLEELEIRKCDLLEQVFCDLELESANVVGGYLSKLQKLHLVDLPRLRLLWDEVPEGIIDFKNLRTLKIHGCSRLRYVFTPAMCLTFAQLQEIEVKHCDILEEIITEDFAKKETVDKIIFPLLNSVSLEHLPTLMEFSSGSGVVQCPILEKISINNCPITFICKFLGEPETSASYGAVAPKVLYPNLKQLTLGFIQIEMVLHARQLERSPYLQVLTSFTVYGCRNLKYLLSSSMVRSLHHLRTLAVSNCNSMEEIIVMEGYEGELLLPELDFLKLKDLPKLAQFCRSNLLECPALKNLWIESCPELRTFICNSANSNKTASNELKLLSSTLFDEKVVFPNLEGLKIFKVGALKEIWSNKLHGDSFHKLKLVNVQDVKKLLNMFPAKLLTRFRNLVWLYIGGCDALQQVFDLRGLTNGENRHTVAAAQLKTLNIYNLPNLRHIWNEDPRGILEFQNLHGVYVTECPSLKSLFPNSVARNLLYLQELRVYSCGIEEIVAEEHGIETPAKFAFPQLTYLDLVRLPHFRRFFPGTHTIRCPVLQKLRVFGNDSIQMSASNFQSVHELCREKEFEIQAAHPSLFFTKVFPDLEQFVLNSKDVTMICQDQFPLEFFHKLKVLELNFFENKRVAFPYDILRRFKCLETLIVARGRFKDLIPDVELVVGKEKPLIMFPEIQSLELHILPNLKNIWHPASQPHHFLQSLESLLIRNCDKLISLGPPSTSLKYLTTMNIMNCKSLASVVTSPTAKSLMQLRKLCVAACDVVSQIVSSDEEDTTDEIIFNRLESLELHYLPSLTSFSSGNQCLKFPSLIEVIVSQCPNMQIFSKVVNTPVLQSVLVTGEKDIECWHGNLNTTIKQLFMEMVGFRGLPQLKLYDFLNLKNRWNGEFPVEEFYDLRSLVVDACTVSSNAVPPNLLRFLNNLEELEVRNCKEVQTVFNVEELSADEEHMELLPQIKRLHLIDLPSLMNVWSEIHHGVMNFKNLKSLNVHNCSSLMMLFTPSMAGRLVQLQEMEVKYCASLQEIITKGEVAAAKDEIIFPRLKSLVLESLPNLTTFYSGSYVLDCLSLEKITAVDCPKIEIFTSAVAAEQQSSTIGAHKEELGKGSLDIPPITLLLNGKVRCPSLKELRVEWNNRIRDIWNGQFFRKLKVFELTRFPVDFSDFPANFLERLPNLEKVLVSDACFEEIFTHDENFEAADHSGNVAQLRQLKLSKLPELRRLIKDQAEPVSVIQNLEALEVIECSKLTTLFPSLMSLKNLTTLELSKCHGLINLMTSSIARSLVQLTRMSVTECNAMEEIISSEGDEGTQGQIVFKQLKHLGLHCLPSLARFCSVNCTFNFPSLEEVIARECPKMEYFVPGDHLYAPDLDSVQITEDEDDWRWNGSLNATIQKLFEEMGARDAEKQ